MLYSKEESMLREDCPPRARSSLIGGSIPSQPKYFFCAVCMLDTISTNIFI